MDSVEKLKDGIGVIAEMTLLFWTAIMDAGADEDTAIVLTSIFMNQVMSN